MVVLLILASDTFFFFYDGSKKYSVITVHIATFQFNISTTHFINFKLQVLKMYRCFPKCAEVFWLHIHNEASDICTFFFSLYDGAARVVKEGEKKGSCVKVLRSKFHERRLSWFIVSPGLLFPYRTVSSAPWLPPSPICLPFLLIFLSQCVCFCQHICLFFYLSASLCYLPL